MASRWTKTRKTHLCYIMFQRGITPDKAELPPLPRVSWSSAIHVRNEAFATSSYLWQPIPLLLLTCSGTDAPPALWRRILFCCSDPRLDHVLRSCGACVIFAASKAYVWGGVKKWKEERQEVASHKTLASRKQTTHGHNLNTLDKQCISTVQSRSVDLTLYTH